MPGSILPLPVMLDEEDRKIYEKLEAPKSMVVRYGYMKMVAELPYDGDAKPGCGSKLVIRTARGIELGEMLTTTCGNSGCGKSVSRKDMLDYIENSGGKNYPFTTQGKILRVATVEDVQEQQRLDANKAGIIKLTRALVRELDLKMKLVDVEMLLGGERVIFHYTSEDWVDFRELVKRLAAEYQTRIEMHQVNARDEARIVADYEKCGQHCCCKQFLKVLKPVSMKSAKVQKATLDPTKISGRCGRLMCCLRYEDETYDELRKRLPKRQTRWMTDDGPGTVIDTQILTQLALILLDKDMSTAAYPIENITAISKEDDAKFQAERDARNERAAEREQRSSDRRDRRDDRKPPQREQRDQGQRGEGPGPRGDEPREQDQLEEGQEQPQGQGERGDRPRNEGQPPRNEGQQQRRDPQQRPGQREGQQREPQQRAPQQRDGQRPDRREPRRDEPRKGEQRRDQPRREDQPPRKDEPKRDEPRRPMPGQPLRDDEVESREGSPPREELPQREGPPQREQPPRDEAIDDRLESPGVSDGEGGDDGEDIGGEMEGGEPGVGGGNEGGPDQPGQPGQPGEGGRKRKRRRRRRRRGGGGGQGGPAGPGGPQGGSPPQGGPPGGP